MRKDTTHLLKKERPNALGTGCDNWPDVSRRKLKSPQNCGGETGLRAQKKSQSAAAGVAKNGDPEGLD